MRAPAVALRGRPLLPQLRAALTPSRRLRRWALSAVAAGLAVAGLYMLVLRDLPLVSIDRVSVTGAGGTDGPRVRRALEEAASGMTTLHLDRARLERAVAPFPSVAGIQVRTDFPHGLRVTVLERTPAAILVASGARAVAAADGTILADVGARPSLPVVRMDGPLPSRRVGVPSVRALLQVAGGAPAALAARLRDVRFEGGRGIVVRVQNGPDLIFGSSERVAAKWLAATRVLADPDAEGAAYVDVRLPERPAAGGLPVKTVTPVAPPAPAPGQSGAAPPQGPAAQGQAGAGRPTTPSPSTPGPQAQPPAARAPGTATPAAPTGRLGGAGVNTQP